MPDHVTLDRRPAVPASTGRQKQSAGFSHDRLVALQRVLAENPASRRLQALQDSVNARGDASRAGAAPNRAPQRQFRDGSVSQLRQTTGPGITPLPPQSFLLRQPPLQRARAAALSSTALSGTGTVQMMPDWMNLLLGIGGVAALGATALGAAPVLAGLGGALALGTGIKGAYDNSQERALDTKPGLDAAFNRLHTREQALLRQLREMGPDQIAARKPIEEQLDQLNVHRRKLVGKTIAGGHELWLPDSVEGVDRDEARDLWSSISGNRGNLQVDQDDPEFRGKALADIAKLLQSKHARRMLGDLNAAPAGGNRTIDIKPTAGGTDNAPKGTLDDGHPGEGSISSINYAEPASNSTGLQDEPIYDPTYIKLGHELGHASHYLKGTNSSSGKVENPETGEGQDKDLWTSQEEYNNITREENPMRADLGLAPRKYHKGYGDALRIRKLLPVRDELSRRYGSLPIDRDTHRKHGPLLEAAEAWIELDTTWSTIPLDGLDAAITRARHDMDRLAEALA